MDKRNFFERYSSNTIGASGNQYYFISDGQRHTGRVFFKIANGGRYEYSLMFTNIIDSTYSDGKISHKNKLCESWTIHSAKAGKCDNIFGTDFVERADEINKSISDFMQITFDGKTQKKVKEGEVFFSEGFEMNIEKGGYICIEIEFSGRMMPYHEESLLPIYELNSKGWKYEKRIPLPCCVACRRKAKARVGFIGDSITQGIGTKHNSYKHWNALLAEMLGDEYAYWNLGLGFGRAEDMASHGIWMEKALENDIIFVCYGVNDLLQGAKTEQIKYDILKIAKTLKNKGKTVIFQTLPPFDYIGDNITKWNDINSFLLTEIADTADMVFDNTEILGTENAKHIAKYGGHPNEKGCAVWAEKLFKSINETDIFQ